MGNADDDTEALEDPDSDGALVIDGCDDPETLGVTDELPETDAEPVSL